MRRIQVPSDWDFAADYDAIVSSMRPKATKNAMRERRGVILESYDCYQKSVPDLASLAAIKLPNEIATKLRDSIKAGSRSEACNAMVSRVFSLCEYTCLFCDISPAEGVDHYLPKEDYPEFSLYANNLIGACSSCNSTKLKDGWRDVDGGRAIFHPYHDDMDIDKEYLVAHVGMVNGRRPEARYELRVDRENARGFERHLDLHFDRLNLLWKCGWAGTKKLLDIAGDLGATTRPSLSKARSWLRRVADQRQKLYGNLHWQTALYRGAANSDAFLEYALSGKRQ
ncbi:MAG: hypothetical protein HC927_04760 [Deltaproteobacteria bacterium]|nr:hypothetical protein [Deltaproteobacteria bacterium]